MFTLSEWMNEIYYSIPPQASNIFFMPFRWTQNVPPSPQTDCGISLATFWKDFLFKSYLYCGKMHHNLNCLLPYSIYILCKNLLTMVYIWSLAASAWAHLTDSLPIILCLNVRDINAAISGITGHWIHHGRILLKNTGGGIFWIDREEGCRESRVVFDWSDCRLID
jgi:hypothetical protein